MQISSRWPRFLRNFRQYYTVSNEKATKDRHEITRQIYSKIKATGPITVAEYMKTILINPLGGYYMHRDVFGSSGDFVTSPELNQIFGEMVAVWFLNEWTKLGAPKPLQIVEFGPGRGSLSQDLLRVFSHFDALKETCLNLIEISPIMSELQAKRLCLQSRNVDDNNSVFYKEGISREGVAVKWFRQLRDVPDNFSLFVAHEFFDALPVHKFERTRDGFREILVDIDTTKEFSFRYVIAKEETPLSKVLIDSNETRQHIEISPETLILGKEIAARIERNGGLALIADYGHDGDGTDTFRAFKKHQLHDPLVEPGSADVTADVDFARLKQAATETNEILAFGPVTQREFLLRMGIEHRFKKLETSVKGEQLEMLKFGYQMMIDDNQMGKRFKFMSLVPATVKKILDKFPLVGFH